MPDTRPSAHPRRRSHRGRRLAAVVLSVAFVAGGITYALSHRHHGGLSPGATSSSVPPTVQATPAGVVREYFAAINDHHWLIAYRLSGQTEPIATFQAGFAGTAHDTVLIKSVVGDVVRAELIASQTDGSQKIYKGTYTVVNGVIGKSDIVQVS